VAAVVRRKTASWKEDSWKEVIRFCGAGRRTMIKLSRWVDQVNSNGRTVLASLLKTTD